MERQQLINFIHLNSKASLTTTQQIADQFEERSLSKNEFLLTEGKINNEYYFLAEGLIRAFTFDIEGNEVTTNFFQKNRTVFEVSSFFLRVPSTENIQAITDCKGFVLTFEKLNGLFHAIPDFREFGRAMLVKEFASFKQRTLALINKSAEERYAELIKNNNDLFKYAQLKHIASYLGITDSSLSRIRREYLKKS